VPIGATDGGSTGYTKNAYNVADASSSAEHTASSTESATQIESDASWGSAPAQYDDTSPYWTSYWIQNGQVYYFQSNLAQPVSVIAGADAANFVVSRGGFGKDENHVYWGDGVIPSADPSTFEALYPPDGQWTCYAKDKDTVWYFCGIGSPYVLGADAPSFRVADDPMNPGPNQCQQDIAYDKSRSYCEGDSDQ
jgi:hypothetical protein